MRTLERVQPALDVSAFDHSADRNTDTSPTQICRGHPAQHTFEAGRRITTVPARLTSIRHRQSIPSTEHQNDDLIVESIRRVSKRQSHSLSGNVISAAGKGCESMFACVFVDEE